MAEPNLNHHHALGQEIAGYYNIMPRDIPAGEREGFARRVQTLLTRCGNTGECPKDIRYEFLRLRDEVEAPQDWLEESAEVLGSFAGVLDVIRDRADQLPPEELPDFLEGVGVDDLMETCRQGSERVKRGESPRMSLRAGYLPPRFDGLAR